MLGCAEWHQALPPKAVGFISSQNGSEQGEGTLEVSSPSLQRIARDSQVSFSFGDALLSVSFQKAMAVSQSPCTWLVDLGAV